MKVLIISGFLGAGKTTFIKELIRHSKQRIVVLENEYGEINLDAKMIRSISDIKVYEFSDGCICCTMKDGFVSSLLTIASSLDPDVLAVEPTGIGKLGSIIKNVKQYEYERIKLLSAVTIVSPDNFALYRTKFPDIYLDQIENAHEVIFSKCEDTDKKELLKLADRIHEISPQTRIRTNHYLQNEQEWWDSLLCLKSENEALSENVRLSDTNVPVELTLENIALSDMGKLILLTENLIRGVYGDIIRAKGVVRCGEFSLRFDLADGRYMISESDTDDSECVFIGNNIDSRRIKSLFTKNRAITFSNRHEI